MKTLLILAFGAAILLLSAFLCQLFWGWAVTPVFGVRAISTWEAFLLQGFCFILLAPTTAGIRGGR